MRHICYFQWYFADNFFEGKITQEEIEHEALDLNCCNALTAAYMEDIISSTWALAIDTEELPF